MWSTQLPQNQNEQCEWREGYEAVSGPTSRRRVALARKTSFRLCLAALLLGLIDNIDPGLSVKASFNTPQYIGEWDGGYCDTIGKHMENYLGAVDEFVVGGLTNSATLVTGQYFQTCLEHQVPFVQLWTDSMLNLERYFSETVYAEDGMPGRYSDITVAKFPDITSLYVPYIRLLVVALQFSDLQGVVQREGTSIIFIEPSGSVAYDARIKMLPPHQRQAAVYLGGSYSRYWTCLIYLRAFEETPREFSQYYLTVGRGTLYHYPRGKRVYGYTDAFGGTLIDWTPAGKMVAGSMTKTGFPGFFPMVYRSFAVVMVPVSHDPPYYSVDSFVDNLSSNNYDIHFLSVPRDVNYNMLSSEHPYLVMVFKYRGGYNCLLVPYFIRMQLQAPYYYLTPLVQTYTQNEQHVVFHQSTTRDGTDIGSDADGILVVKFPLSVQCSNSGPIIQNYTFTPGSQYSVTMIDHRFGRACASASGQAPHCQVTSASKRARNDPNFFWMATTDAVYLDSVGQDYGSNSSDVFETGFSFQESNLRFLNRNYSDVSFPPTIGKFIMIQNSYGSQLSSWSGFANSSNQTTDLYYVPQFDSPLFVNRTLWAPSENTHSVSYPSSQYATSHSGTLRPQRVYRCYQNNYQATFGASFPNMTNLTSRIDYYGGLVELDDPVIQVTCSGSSTGCRECPIGQKLMVVPVNLTNSTYDIYNGTNSTANSSYDSYNESINYGASYNLTRPEIQAFRNDSNGKYYFAADGYTGDFVFALRVDLFDTDHHELMGSYLSDFQFNLSLDVVYPWPVEEPEVPDPNITVPEPNITVPEPNITDPVYNYTDPDLNSTDPGYNDTPGLNYTDPNITDPFLNITDPEVLEPVDPMPEPELLPNFTEPTPPQVEVLDCILSEQHKDFVYHKSTLVEEYPNQSWFYLSLETLFRYDEGCQPTSYQILNEASVSEFIIRQGSYLFVDITNSSSGSHEVMVEGLSAYGKQAIKSVFFNLQNPQEETKIPQPLNKPPYFDPEAPNQLPTQLEFHIVANFTEVETFLLTSPLAIDPEGDDIFLDINVIPDPTENEVQFQQGAPFYSVKDNRNHTFTLKVFKHLVTYENQMNFTVAVTLRDPSSAQLRRTSEVYSTRVVVTKEQLIIVEEEDEIEANTFVNATENTTVAIVEEIQDVVVEDGVVQEMAQEVYQPTILVQAQKPTEEEAEAPFEGLRNQKVTVVEYRKKEDMMTSPQPSISKMTVSKKAEVNFMFDKVMEMKREWYQKLEADSRLFASLEQDTKRLLTASTSDMAYFKFYSEDAVTGLKKEIKNVYLKELTGTSIGLKLEFENPETISLGSQTTPDNLVVNMDEDLVLNDKDGYSLVLNEGVAKKGGVQIGVPIQPQVLEDSENIKTMEVFIERVHKATYLMILAQLIMSLHFDTKFHYLIALIGSQQNIAYLPCIGVNMPGQINLYLSQMVELISFDPFPVEDVLFDFEWTDKPPSNHSFQTIGLEDRVFIHVLGCLFWLMCLYIVTQLIASALSNYQDNNTVAAIHDTININASKRQVVILFFILMYTELLIGGLINNENAYLFDLGFWSNFGPGGVLNFSDQFSIIAGYIFYISVIFFPFYVIYVLQEKHDAHFETQLNETQFNRNYKVLFRGLRTDVPGYLQFYTIYLLRRAIFVALVYNLTDPTYILVQIFAVISMSFYYSLYLIHFKPYVNQSINRVHIVNEVFLIGITYHLLVFTDYAQTAETKYLAGWSMLLLCATNFLIPNVASVAWFLLGDFKRRYKAGTRLQRMMKRAAQQSILKQKREELFKKYHLLPEEGRPRHMPETPGKLKQVLPDDQLGSGLGRLYSKRNSRQERRLFTSIPNTIGQYIRNDPRQLQMSQINELTSEMHSYSSSILDLEDIKLKKVPSGLPSNDDRSSHDTAPQNHPPSSNSLTSEFASIMESFEDPSEEAKIHKVYNQ